MLTAFAFPTISVGICSIVLAVAGSVMAALEFKGWKRITLVSLFLILGIGEVIAIKQADTVHTKEIKDTAQQVATETSKQVTEVVTGQFKQTVADLQKENATLQAKLEAQAKDVSVIKNSNIVTGKSPLKVEVTNPTSVPPPQKPIITGIRIASQKQIASDDPKLPFGLEVIVQTDVEISPVKLAVICDGPIGVGRAGFDSGGVYTMVSSGLAQGNENIFITKWESPPWTPEKNIVFCLYSKQALHALDISRNVN